MFLYADYTPQISSGNSPIAAHWVRTFRPICCWNASTIVTAQGRNRLLRESVVRAMVVLANVAPNRRLADAGHMAVRAIPLTSLSPGGINDPSGTVRRTDKP